MLKNSVNEGRGQQSMDEKPVKFHSRFGGLWIDRSDFSTLIEDRESSGALSSSQANLIRDFVRDGYVIIRNAVDSRLIDTMNAYSDSLWANGSKEVLVS